MGMLRDRWSAQRYLCVGLDPDPTKLPAVLKSRYAGVEEVLYRFLADIVEATATMAACYKPNLAFFLRYGEEGPRALSRLLPHIWATAPGVPVILDAKWADIGRTNEGYAELAFKVLAADAITLHPYLGQKALEPFLRRPDKGFFVLCRTSNPGAGEFQDLQVREHDEPLASNVSLYQYVARRVAERWNAAGNCGLVVGATYPDELGQVRKIVGDLPILLPGLGTQGGDLEQSLKNGMGKDSFALVPVSASGIIHASQGEDYAQAAEQAARTLHEAITAFRSVPA